MAGLILQAEHRFTVFFSGIIGYIPDKIVIATGGITRHGNGVKKEHPVIAQIDVARGEAV